MKKVKIYGAGSIGNHLAQACRRIGWDVTICDIDPLALKRTKEIIYPSRYGKWDETIKLYTVDDVPKGNFDVIFIGTPPDTHLKIALEVIKEKPSLLQIEKPLCTPTLEDAQRFFEEISKTNIKVCIGFDHVVSKSTKTIGKILNDELLGNVETIDVEFREHWSGIFAAHPWLTGPQDTYLGFWKKGGGACSEHSHAINLWQHFANILGKGKVIEVNSSMLMVKDDKVDYDKIAYLNLKTENGLIGRVVQDFVTKPPKKWARIQFENGYIEWHCNLNNEGDVVIYQKNTDTKKEIFIPKKRPDDFYEEILHINDILENRINIKDSPIAIEKGLDTAIVIAAAHISRLHNKTVKIDYSKGYTLEAISTL